MLDMITSQPLSQGAYGRVSNSWIPNVVIKTAPFDPAWAYWAAFCIQFQDESPYLPHIQLPLNTDYLLTQLLPPIRDIFALFLSFVRSETEPADSFRFDGHNDNWMFRGTQLVMTDPVATPHPLFDHPRITIA